MGSFRLRHEFNAGAAFLGLELATCLHCGTLRARDERRGGEVVFIRRVADEEERVRGTEPPCIEPARAFRAPW